MGSGVGIGTRLRLWLCHRRHGLNGIGHLLAGCADPAPVLRRFGAAIASDAAMGPRPRLHAAPGSFAPLQVAAGARVGADCFLDLTDRIELQPGSVLGDGCTVITHHTVGRSPLAEEFPASQAPVVLEREAVVGAGCLITAGVVVGAGARVGAGSVVHKSVLPGAVVRGNPARVWR